MRRIDTLDDIAEGLSALAAADPRLTAVIETAEEVTLRRSEPGFASLVSIIVSQQVSRASAQAMMRRLTALADPLTAHAIAEGGPDMLREAGISRPKQRAILALAESLDAGTIDLEALCLLDAEEAIGQLTVLPGIGPWTAQIYLLFSAELWSPWRGVAARLFWAYHHATMGRSAAPMLTPAEADPQTPLG
jgi:DNA-3-methyladenine glycosylase II